MGYYTYNNLLFSGDNMTDIIYMPSNVFIMLSAFFLLLVIYSFSTQDKTYYTDVISSLFSVIVAVLLGYNSIIGIGYNYAMSSSISYDNFKSVPLALLFGALSIYLLLMMVAKIIDIIRHNADVEEMNDE